MKQNISDLPVRRLKRAPVAVVMGLTVTGLSVGRALGRRGIEVIGIHSGTYPHAARSRYIRFAGGPESNDADIALHFYLDLGRRLGAKAVLLPTGDQNVLLISRFRDELAKYFRFYVCDSELLDQITSKRQFAQLSKHYGFPMPPTIFPKNRKELEDNIGALEFPCVIKPEFTHLWQTTKARAAKIGGKKAIPVENQTELFHLYDQLVRVDSHIVIQQMVNGPDENNIESHAFVDPDGEIRAEFVGRKCRLSPTHYGMGCYVKSTWSEQAIEITRFILHRIKYQGMVNLDFKQDTKDGKIYLFEINPRFSVWTALPIACGIDFPYYYYKTCLQEPYTVPSKYISGKSWLNPVDDLWSMREYAKDGSWTWWRWFITVLRSQVNAYFGWDDPLPWVTLIANLIKRGGRKFLQRIIKS